MITYRMIDATCPLPSCLHSGPLTLAQCWEPAYIETKSDIPKGAVARCLQAISNRYGACGVLAVEDDLVVGKIRAFPQAIMDRVPAGICVQQEQFIRPLLALDIAGLPARDEHPVLHLDCIQVASAYYGQGIAGGMLDALIAWARANGWRELRTRAVNHIPPLLAWCGQMSRDALEHRGFTVTGSFLSPELREGVVSQRGGYHGEAVRAQWEAFAHLSDDDAGMMFDMVCVLA